MISIETGNRGVSELIGFVLVFSLVVAVVGIVSVAGLGSLQDARDFEQLENAERAMTVLADNMADIQDRGAPSRATEISLDDAHIRTGSEVTVKVTDTTVSPTLDESYSIRPIIYSGARDTELVYVMGAIFRVQPEGEAVLREWDPIVNGERAVVAILNTSSKTGGVKTIQSATVLVRGNAVERELVRANRTGDFGGGDTTLRIEDTPRRDLWIEMLDARSGFDCSEDGPQVAECEIGPEVKNFYLTRTRVVVALKG